MTDSSSQDKSQCEHCGGEFSKRREWARFCSDKCRVAHHEVSRAKAIIGRDLATVSEAARIAGVDASTIRKWVKRGKVKSETLAGRIMVFRRDIESRL